MSCSLMIALALWLAPAGPTTAGVAHGARVRVPTRAAMPTAKRKVRKPTRAQLPRAAHKAVRARALGKPHKVAFVPCSTSLPKQAPTPKAASKLAPGKVALVADKFYLWPNGATINVHFTDGSMEARHAVAELVVEWSKYANLHFAFFFDSDKPPDVTHVRVRFDDPNCNSALGTSSQYMIDSGDASMRLCHVDGMLGTEWFPRVVLHEFGHAIGMEHEHQSPKAHFDWDKPVVYKYYQDTAGWDAAFVDQWVFRQIAAETVDASDYDPDSIMQYSFPPEFTKDHRAILGNHELSATDKAWVAKTYPGVKKGPTKPKAKPSRFYERAIAVRNGTGMPLDVQLVHESFKKGHGWSWAPGAAVGDATSVPVDIGEELALAGVQGRKVKVVAKSRDGKKTWSAHAEQPVVVATRGGYVDRDPQTWVVTIDGPADPTNLGKDELYTAGSEALDASDFQLARARFGEFIARFPDDDWRGWAELSIIIAWMGDREWSSALAAAYDLAVGKPGTDPGAYAWYYGGLAAMQLGQCADAKEWFDFVLDPSTGLPSDWRASAKENLAAMKDDAATWCR